uniref:Uncharacterized protein n=1 Tax=Malurus cyaneus samueli TaxID=2593467 RepID=A0A8C5U9C6_9PASS
PHPPGCVPLPPTPGDSWPAGLCRQKLPTVLPRLLISFPSEDWTEHIRK